MHYLFISLLLCTTHKLPLANLAAVAHAFKSAAAIIAKTAHNFFSLIMIRHTFHYDNKSNVTAEVVRSI